MLLSAARVAPLPRTVSLAESPLIPVPLSSPPEAVWVSLGRHGTMAREDYRLPELWCLHLYRWTGALRAGAVTLPVRPGHASIVPPDTPLSHFFRTADPPALHLTCGFRLSAPGIAPVLPMPMMCDTGPEFGRLDALFLKAIGAFAGQPRRAEAIVWEILWRLAESGEVAGSGADTETAVVALTRETVELRLAEPLRVADLARAAELSHNHFTRLFHAATGKTVVAYIRERRIERALRLLRYTTLPIKQVAAQVGLPDLHQFNKAIRAATGLAPRTVRAGSATDGPAEA